MNQRTEQARRLPRPFFRRQPVTVARALLGKRLLSQADGVRTVGTIVEVEAYLGVSDKAAHTYGGRCTARNETMWGDGGYAYVYFVYGMHHCVNVVAGTTGDPVAVLIRALEPCEGLPAMAVRRPNASHPTDLCSGPAKLTAALGIDRSMDGADLVKGTLLYLEATSTRALPSRRIGVGPRVGIGYAEDWVSRPLRFWVRGNPHVSRV